MSDNHPIAEAAVRRFVPSTKDECLFRIIDKIDAWSPEGSLVKPSMIDRVVFVSEQSYQDRLFALLIIGQNNLASLIGASELSFWPDHPDRYILEHFRNRLNRHGILKRELCSAADGSYDRICEESIVRSKDLVPCVDDDHLRFFSEWNMCR